MKVKEILKKIIENEITFQVVLHLIVFSFYAIDRRNPEIEESEIVFFANLSLMAFIINYVLLPNFFYQQKYIHFILFVILILGVNIVMEELVLEQIYFPDTRATRFPGIFFTLFGILPVITILVGFKFAWDAYGKQREVDRLKKLVKESELQFLKSQINPHFLFNSLNNLYANAIEKSERTPEIILELSNVLRYMLYDCKSAYVPLQKEIKQIGNFIKISELQIEERGTITFNIPDKIHDFQIAPLLLIVFVENSFKHSTASQSKDIKIDISIVTNQLGELIFRCTNSYEQLTNVDNLSSGIGLENVKKRLNLLYPNAHQLKIESTDKEYRVYLSLQLNTIITK